jgi:hypothetical protein
MTYEKLMEFLGHFKSGNLKRHLRVEDNSEGLTYDQHIYNIKGNNALEEFLNSRDREKLVLFHSSVC